MGYQFWRDKKDIVLKLINEYNGELLNYTPRIEQIPKNKILVLIIYDNEKNEKASLVFKNYEIEAWETDPTDFRKRQWVMADKSLMEASGFNENGCEAEWFGLYRGDESLAETESDKILTRQVAQKSHDILKKNQKPDSQPVLKEFKLELEKLKSSLGNPDEGDFK